MAVRARVRERADAVQRRERAPHHVFAAQVIGPEQAVTGRMEEELGPQADAAMPFTAIFSQGTSGDSMWMDYSGPKPTTTLEEYTEGLVDAATKRLPTLEYRNDAALAMAETKLTLKRRVPDEARLTWAREKLAAMEGRPPKDRAEVYAQEAIYLHEEPQRELKLQAIRIGDFGIAAIPNEKVVESMQLFGQEVLPHVHDL